MFFDTLAGIAERHLPEFAPMLAKARLFRMESHRPMSSASEAVAKWAPDTRVIENYRLPFPTIAIEEADTRYESGGKCVVLSVLDEAARRFSFFAGEGRDKPFTFGAGELIALPNAEQEIGDYTEVMKVTRLRVWEGNKKTGLRMLAVNAATIDVTAESNLVVNAPGKNESTATVTIAGKKMTLGEFTANRELMESVREQMWKCRDKTLAELLYLQCAFSVLSVAVINEPASFIVEERPLIPPRHEQANTIRRSIDRPHYIVLKPRQIRERFLWPDGRTEEEKEAEEAERSKVTPHERRGHHRRLQSERYTKARGQLIWIKPMWIGPQEAVKGNNRYKVRLDL